MTHPTRAPGGLTPAEAMARISDREMTEMCLAVNLAMGSAAANRLLDLFAAARRETARREAGRGGPPSVSGTAAEGAS